MIKRLSTRWRLRASGAALLFPPLVHLTSLDRITRWIAGRPVASTGGAVDDRALAEWVDRVLHRLPPPWRHTCLKRAVVLHYLIHRAGRITELHIGVRREIGDALAAHAWLVRDGIPYLEARADRIDGYRLLTAFPTRLEHEP